MITFVLWDMDGTLFDFLLAEKAAIRYCMGKAGVSLSDADIAAYSQINDKYWKRYERGEIDQTEVFEGRFRAFFASKGINGVDVAKLNHDYQIALGEEVFFTEGAEETLLSLREKGVFQAIVTNGNAYSQRRKLEKAGVMTWFDALFISEEVGEPKPDKAFFDALAQKIPGFSPDKAVIVGDSLSSDIKGGENAGLITCWYNPSRHPSPKDIKIDYEITAIEQVLTLPITPVKQHAFRLYSNEVKA